MVQLLNFSNKKARTMAGLNTDIKKPNSLGVVRHHLENHTEILEREPLHFFEKKLRHVVSSLNSEQS